MEHQLDMEHRLTEVEVRSKGNERRIVQLEDLAKSIYDLAKNMELMMQQQTQMGENLTKLTGDVETLKAEPGKKWRFVVEKAIYFVVGGVVSTLVALILAKVGLG